MPFPADKYQPIHPKTTARLRGVWPPPVAVMHGSSSCEFKLTMLLTETEIVGLGATIWPGYLHAARCRNAMMEPEQSRLEQSFVESGVFPPGCRNGMTFLQGLCSAD